MNSQKVKEVKCAIYCRKSSEDRDKQVLSLPAQIDWAKQIAARAGITIHDQDIFREEKSAEAPYNRPVFDQLIEKIRNNEINVLICWKLDRLARNPEEAGIILGLLKRGQIDRIITNDREYRPGDNAIISYVDSFLPRSFAAMPAKGSMKGWQRNTYSVRTTKH